MPDKNGALLIKRKNVRSYHSVRYGWLQLSYLSVFDRETATGKMHQSIKEQSMLNLSGYDASETFDLGVFQKIIPHAHRPKILPKQILRYSTAFIVHLFSIFNSMAGAYRI